ANEQQGNLVRLARAANAVVFATISPYGEFGPDSARYVVVASLDARGSLRYRARATDLDGEELEAGVPIRGAWATVRFEDVMLYSRLAGRFSGFTERRLRWFLYQMTRTGQPPPPTRPTPHHNELTATGHLVVEPGSSVLNPYPLD
ncbi:hypothetical protein LTR66_010464, partial [Elasticomyces elasticus]